MCIRARTHGDVALLAGSPRAARQAVSYTHLDVYKRQDNHRASFSPAPQIV
ncbi:hypothetical protein [Erwinia amylovora]